VVEHRQDQRLQPHALGERPGNGQDGRSGEEQLALGVPVDVAREAVIPQPGGGGLVDDAGPAQVVDVLGLEAELPDQLDQPAGPGDHAVAPPGRQPAGERLEDAPPVGRAVLEGGADHGQLVLVGEQRRGEVGHAPTLLRQ
jgi:hypothetical protein